MMNKMRAKLADIRCFLSKAFCLLSLTDGTCQVCNPCNCQRSCSPCCSQMIWQKLTFKDVESAILGGSARHILPREHATCSRKSKFTHSSSCYMLCMQQNYLQTNEFSNPKCLQWHPEPLHAQEINNLEPKNAPSFFYVYHCNQLAHSSEWQRRYLQGENRPEGRHSHCSRGRPPRD